MAPKVTAISVSGFRITVKSEPGLSGSLNIDIQEFKYGGDSGIAYATAYKRLEDAFLSYDATLNAAEEGHLLI